MPTEVHSPCVEHMLVTVICSSEEDNFNTLFEKQSRYHESWLHNQNMFTVYTTKHPDYTKLLFGMEIKTFYITSEESNRSWAVGLVW